MLTAITAVIAFLTSFAPSLLNFFTAKENNAQQLRLAQFQLEAQKAGYDAQLALANTQADIQQQQSLYSYDAAATGIKWVDALRGLVRPYITLVIFHMWVAIEVAALVYGLEKGLSLDQIIKVVWTEETSSLFAAVVAFWFGQRAATYGLKAAQLTSSTATTIGKVSPSIKR